MNELNQLRDSAAKYVVSDVRPISAIAGEGLIQLIYSAIQLGWRYPHMNIADLKNALPSRNSLIPRVKELAENGLKLLGRKIHDAINVSGKFAATTDMWTEPNNSTLTMALTFHFFTVEEAGIKLEAYTGDVREIKATSMTAAVIKHAIYDILADYGVDEDAREHMTIVMFVSCIYSIMSPDIC